MIAWNKAVTKRAGMALALSGGGFRATLFHLGAFRRLDELGVLDKLDAISSVSGGSIAAACLADWMTANPNPGSRTFQDVADKVHALTSFDLRRHVFLERVAHPLTGLAELVARELSSRVTRKPLSQLPTRPQFLFCATDMVFGVNWVYTHDTAGDWQAGYSSTGLDAIGIAHAAAASACFPPVFKPIDAQIAPTTFQGGAAVGADADECRTKIRLTDGGVYDNMGLEPVWKSAETVLVSDAGGLFGYDADEGTVGDVERYPDVMGTQALDLRRRWLIASFISGVGPGGLTGLQGTYWRTAGTRSAYDSKDTSGYPADVATLIARVRTDLNDFSEGESAVLENHGYLMADVALKMHVPALYSTVPVQPPYPKYMDPAVARDALKDSAKRPIW